MADPRDMKPVFGITEIPERQYKRRTSGAELIDDKLVAELEALGVRLAWTRASICPCTPWNDQTRQPDPTCSRCQGGSALYFGPKDYVPPSDVGQLTPVQRRVIQKDGAAVIRGVIQRVTQAQDFYDMFGNWVRGTMQVTVRSENRIGFYDRLVNLDSEVAYSELIKVGYDKRGARIDETDPIRLRYLATGVNAIHTEITRYEQDEHFSVENGEIVFFPSRRPAVGTILSVHYLMHPTWLVIDHPHVLRETQRRRKIRDRDLVSPLGNPTPLPIQAAVRLEFLPAREIPASIPP